MSVRGIYSGVRDKMHKLNNQGKQAGEDKKKGPNLIKDTKKEMKD